jgi:hypothetical protein
METNNDRLFRNGIECPASERFILQFNSSLKSGRDQGRLNAVQQCKVERDAVVRLLSGSNRTTYT